MAVELFLQACVPLSTAKNDDEEEGCAVYGSFVMLRFKSVNFQPRVWFSKVGLDRNHYCPAFIYELISVPYGRFFSRLLQ